MYFFIIVTLLHTLTKALFIAFGQKYGTVQAVGLLVLELVLLIAICIMRPFMDKKTNGVNISIAVVNFLNVILLLFFSNIFGVPVSQYFKSPLSRLAESERTDTF